MIEPSLYSLRYITLVIEQSLPKIQTREIVALLCPRSKTLKHHGGQGGRYIHSGLAIDRRLLGDCPAMALRLLGLGTEKANCI